MKHIELSQEELIRLMGVFGISHKAPFSGKVIGKKKKVYTITNNGKRHRFSIMKHNVVKKSDFEDKLEEFMETVDPSYALDRILKHIMERDEAIYWMDQILKK